MKVYLVMTPSVSSPPAPSASQNRRDAVEPGSVRAASNAARAKKGHRVKASPEITTAWMSRRGRNATSVSSVTRHTPPAMKRRASR